MKPRGDESVESNHLIRLGMCRGHSKKIKLDCKKDSTSCIYITETEDTHAGETDA